MTLVLCGLCSCAAITGASPARCFEGPRPVARIAIRDGPPAAPVAQWMAFSPDGRYLAVRISLPVKRDGVQDAGVRVYGTSDWKEVATATILAGGQRHNRSVLPGCGLARNGWLVVSDQTELRFVAIPPNKPSLPGGGRLALGPSVFLPAQSRMWVNPTGTAVFVAGQVRGAYSLQRVDLGSVPAGTSRVRLILDSGGPVDRLMASAFNPAANRFAAVIEPLDRRGKPVLECWTVGDKPARSTAGVGVSVGDLAISPAGTLVAIGCLDGTVAWHDAVTAQRVKRPTTLGQRGVMTMAFHPSGQYLACGTSDNKGQSNLFFVKAVSGEIVARWAPEPDGMAMLCFNPAGDRLAAVGSQGDIKIWDVKQLLRLEGE